ncbi:MAG: manganese efflux pump MntP [Planctomycetota bacterium]|jgi:putative Mn2+ efflux pump MntP
MEMLTITFIALGLAMDAFAVSVVSGSAYKQLKVRHFLQIAIFFGFFQAFMPLIGALAGLTIKKYIAVYDHWVASALLFVVGVKMIYESFKIKSTDKNFDPSNIFVLLILSIATSIDALAVGITLPLLVVSLATAVIIIGLVTFILSYIGVSVGRKFGHFFESKIEALGGIVLIALGAKILIEHLLL